MNIEFDIHEEIPSIIKIIGVGGGGCNAVMHMYAQGIVGVNFVVANTDAQALQANPVPTKIQLGPLKTNGRGAGSIPSVGRDSALESIKEIEKVLGDGTDMVFITAGMGGGTGTGGAPVVAEVARKMGILVVGIVTLPFDDEGPRRRKQAEEGIEELRKFVDTLIIISNDKLVDIYEDLPITASLAKADEVLLTAAKGIAEIITIHGKINVDFEDVNTVMRQGGVAMMSTGIGEGEDKAIKAVQAALNSPLLQDNQIKGARHVLLNMVYGNTEITMGESKAIRSYVQEVAGHEADIIWGLCQKEELGDKVAVTLVATGFSSEKKIPSTPIIHDDIWKRQEELKRKAEEDTRLDEEKRTTEEAAQKAEEKRIAEEVRAAEEAARKAEEKRAAEEAARKAEEKRAAEEAARVAAAQKAEKIPFSISNSGTSMRSSTHLKLGTGSLPASGNSSEKQSEETQPLRPLNDEDKNKLKKLIDERNNNRPIPPSLNDARRTMPPLNTEEVLKKSTHTQDNEKLSSIYLAKDPDTDEVEPRKTSNSYLSDKEMLD